MGKMNIKVVTTDKDIAIQFYHKVIGLDFKKDTANSTSMICDNCNVEISESIK